MAYDPFNRNLYIPTYDLGNIKKIYDVFPRLLRVKQLTSQELLEELQKQLQQKDVRIEELLGLINSFGDRDESLSQLQDLINNLEGTLDSGLGDLVSDLTNQSELQTLQAQGYRRIGNTSAFIRVDEGVGSTKIPGYTFVQNNFNEGRGDGRTESPLRVYFKNIGEQQVTVQIKEQWVDSNKSSQYEQYNENIKVFSFVQIDTDNLGDRRVILNPSEEKESGVSGERRAETLSNYGVGRPGDGNIQHYGNMIFSVGDETLSYPMAIERDSD